MEINHGREAEKLCLTTERLLLYPISNEAMRQLIEQEKNPDMKQAYTEMLQGCFAHPQERIWNAVWNIALKENPQIIVGDFCFKGLEADGMVEIGYGMKEGYCNHGYMTEAVKAVSAWAMEQADVTRVEAEADPDNYASQRVLEKAGYIKNGQQRIYRK